MALFPAYAEQTESTKEPVTELNEEKTWLENSSFQAENSNVVQRNIEIAGQSFEIFGECNTSPSSKQSVESPPRKKRKKDSHKQKYRAFSPEKPVEQKNDPFTIDTTRTLEYLTVDTIYRPAKPKFKVKYYLTNFNTRKYKKHKWKRYFKIILDKKIDESDNEEQIITKQNINTLGTSKKDEHFTGFKQEEELTKTTEFYNKGLAEAPNDIKLWLKYVNFQDVIYQFEKSYRKGSIAKAQRVLAERKIAILDKALTHNVNNEELLRERLKVAVSAFPSDELQQQLKKLVENEKGNIILWQGYIEATQCSMSHCNTPAVLALYTKCLSTLHQLRRHKTLEKHLLEESILRMLYQCGLFLKQTGLFEQLWTLIRMYLEMNLSPNDKSKFNVTSGFNEKQLIELEEVVFDSQLPLHELWLRTEKLRESCHWMPHTEETDCEDPQRIVLTEDVVELIHPITVPENIFKLVATVLTLLKVPLLPCRHCTMQDLGLDYVPWSVDSIESILPVFFPLYALDITNEKLLTDTSRLAVGPQYLKVLPGQEEYLQLILLIMENCADCLKGDDQVAVRVWWFRFQRLLVVLDKQGRFKMPQYLRKKIKTNIKNLLKREEHRNNEIFYLEYALIEKELSGAENCIKIIQTAISMNKNIKIAPTNWDQSQTNQCQLYRILVETFLEIKSDTKNNRQEALRNLVKLVLQRNFENVTNGILMEAETKYKLISTQLLENNTSDSQAITNFLPDFATDWLICHGWFLFLYKGPLECGVFIENTLASINAVREGPHWQKEILYEFYVAVLLKYCVENPGSGVFKILDDTLYRAIENYPNNLFLLAVLAKEQSLLRSLGKEWWKIQDMLLKSNRALPIVFAIIVNEQVKCQIEENCKDTITGYQYDTSMSYKYKLTALFKKITKNDICTRRCGLVWRLYLQFVHAYFDLDVCRNVYYSAVEECPWLKALYIDAAIYIPGELSQIQDLIIEKQLRLHVAPEELDILRT